MKRLVLCWLVTGLFFPPAGADTAERQERAFIACPVYRDTDAGPKSGCWLATHDKTGIRYDVSAALTKPQLGKMVLVEGVTSDTGNFCGGQVLQPVRVSVLNRNCPEHLLPAEDYPSRRFSPPDERMQPLTVPRQLPEPPFENRTWSILFNFQSDFFNYQYSEVLLEKIALYIKASQARRVKVIGYSASKPYPVDGEPLREGKSLATRRADMAILALTRLGVNPAIITKSTSQNPDTVTHYAGGLAEETRRRVDIVVSVE